MRLGFLGPAVDEALLREAITYLFVHADVDQVVYLGDAEFLEQATERWGAELDGGDEAFLSRAAAVALSGTAEDIERLLLNDRLASKLPHLRKLPPPPARAVEMVDDRVVLIVHDKSVLDEEDIANASLIVYGVAAEAGLRRFGKRAFFTPGPLEGRRVGLIEVGDDGVFASIHDLEGTASLREALAAATTKLTVTG